MFNLVISAIAVGLVVSSLFVFWFEQRTLRRMRAKQQEQASYYRQNERWYRSASFLQTSSGFSQLLDDLKVSTPYLTNVTPISFTRSRLVARAIDRRTGRAVALKTLVGEAVASAPNVRGLFNEAFILSVLDGTRSPKLVSALSTATGRPILVRDYQDGVSLDRVLIRNSTLDIRPRYSEVKALLQSTSSALTEIHGIGVVHGDLKPANLVANWKMQSDGLPTITPLGDVTLLDFESAAVLDSVGVADSRSQRGTAFFMAPERYASSLIGKTADVYSISALASLLLTGKPSRPGQSAGARIPSQDLREAIRKGFSVFIEERHASIEDWINDVTPALDELIERSGDQMVDWPVSMNEFAREVAYQTATVDTSLRLTRNFDRVIESVLAMSLDLNHGELDTRARTSAEFVSAYYRNELIAQQLLSRGDVAPERLRRRIQDAVQFLDETNRRRAATENPKIEDDSWEEISILRSE